MDLFFKVPGRNFTEEYVWTKAKVWSLRLLPNIFLKSLVPTYTREISQGIEVPGPKFTGTKDLRNMFGILSK